MSKIKYAVVLLGAVLFFGLPMVYVSNVNKIKLFYVNANLAQDESESKEEGYEQEDSHARGVENSKSISGWANEEDESEKGFWESVWDTITTSIETTIDRSIVSERSLLAAEMKGRIDALNRRKTGLYSPNTALQGAYLEAKRAQEKHMSQEIVNGTNKNQSNIDIVRGGIDAMKGKDPKDPNNPDYMNGYWDVFSLTESHNITVLDKRASNAPVNYIDINNENVLSFPGNGGTVNSGGMVGGNKSNGTEHYVIDAKQEQSLRKCLTARVIGNLNCQSIIKNYQQTTSAITARSAQVLAKFYIRLKSEIVQINGQLARLQQQLSSAQASETNVIKQQIQSLQQRKGNNQQQQQNILQTIETKPVVQSVTCSGVAPQDHHCQCHWTGSQNVCNWKDNNPNGKE